MLEQGDISLREQPKLLNILGKMCSRFKTIPDSMHIESCPKVPMNEEYDGGSAIVSRGEYRGRPVAIKTLRLYIAGNFKACFSVSAELS